MFYFIKRIHGSFLTRLFVNVVCNQKLAIETVTCNQKKPTHVISFILGNHVITYEAKIK